MQYIYHYDLKCLACNASFGNSLTENQSLDATITAVIQALSAKKQAAIKSWEEQAIKACSHSGELVQSKLALEGRSLAHCGNCDLNNNLWLCLSCGNLGCGRAQYGGIGGNGHALAHFESTGHPLCVKMGTITPQGTADVFCYAHGTEVTDEKLAEHLANFGINVESQSKTVQSLAELVHLFNVATGTESYI